MIIDKFDEKIGTHGLTRPDASSVWTNPTDPLPTLIFDRNQDWSEVTEEFVVISINQIVQTLADLKYARHFTGINHSHRRDIGVWLLIIFFKNEFVFAYPSVKIIIFYLYLYLRCMYQNSRYFIVFVWTLAVAVASPFLVVSTIFEFRVSTYSY